MQVKDQDLSSSRIMFSRVADGKLFPWGREHFIPQPDNDPVTGALRDRTLFLKINKK